MKRTQATPRPKPKPPRPPGHPALIPTGANQGECGRSGKEQLPLVYSCSGASSAAQMANHLAVRLDRLQVAEMSCIAGVGGDVKPLVRIAKSGRPIIVLDGCPLQCAAKILKRHGLKADRYYNLSQLGVKKRSHEDFDPVEAARVLQHILADPALPLRRLQPPARLDAAEEAEETPHECASPPCYLAEFVEPDSSGDAAG